MKLIQDAAPAPTNKPAPTSAFAKIAVDYASSGMLNELRTTVAEGRNHAAGEVEKFANRLAQYPANAFEWSDDAFTQAARMEIADKFLEWTDGNAIRKPGETDEVVLRKIANHFHDEILRGAKWPHHSTSVASNVTAERRLSATAELAEKIEHALRA